MKRDAEGPVPLVAIGTSGDVLRCLKIAQIRSRRNLDVLMVEIQLP